MPCPKVARLQCRRENVRLRGDETGEFSEGEFAALSDQRYRRRHSARSVAEDLRAIFHDEKSRQGHRARSLAGLRIRAAVGWRNWRPQPGRPGNAGHVLFAAQPRAVTTVVPETTNQTYGEGEIILVVEDNPDVKTVATTLLEQLNYRTWQSMTQSPRSICWPRGNPSTWCFPT